MRLFLSVFFITVTTSLFAQTGAQISRPSGATNGTLPVPLSGSSQGNILGDPFRGQDFKANDNMGETAGQPYLYDDWKSGEVTLKNGENYKISKLNFDASQNKFIYVAGDSIFELRDNVREVKIHANSESDGSAEMIFRTDINPAAANYVQLITKGKIIIFCDYLKKPEGENYSNGIMNNSRKYVLHKNYFVISNNTAIPVKFTESALEDFTNDRKDKVSSYVKEANLKLKKESDFFRAINYYNSLN